MGERLLHRYLFAVGLLGVFAFGSEAFAGLSNIQFATSSSSGSESTTTVNITVTRSIPLFGTSKIDFDVTGGTATGGDVDYSLESGTLTFGSGVSSQTLTFTVANDLIDEPDETIEISLTNPQNATKGANDLHTYTITDDDVPAISINDVSVVETDGLPATATFTASLSIAPVNTVTVSFATRNGTAVGAASGPRDYTSTTGTLTFTPGETSRTISVSVIGENLNEADETFFVDLSNPTNATVADGTGQGTIVNNDPLPALTLTNTISFLEAHEDHTVSFTLFLGPASGQTVNVDFSTQDVTAQAGSDYLAATGTVTFLPGTTSQTVSVTVRGDLFVEEDETFQINFSNPVNTTMAESERVGVATIQNDDAYPIVDFTSFSGIATENGASVEIGVSLDRLAAEDVTVNLSYVGSFANPAIPASPGDYSGPASLVIPAGSTTGSLTVSATDDSAYESLENVTISISSATNGRVGGSDTFQMRIASDDAAPLIRYDAVSVTEGDSGTQRVTIRVLKEGASDVNAAVDYSLARRSGSSAYTTDYSTSIGSLTFLPAETEKDVVINVHGDAIDEFDEVLYLNFTNAGDATINASSMADITITDNDAAPEIYFSGSSFTEPASGIGTFENSGDGSVRVYLTSYVEKTVTVDVASSGTAASFYDFHGVPATQRLTYPIGMETGGRPFREVTFSIVDDAIDEATETLIFTLTNPTNAPIISGTGSEYTVSIGDNDDPPSVTA
ncbi:MAG: hypothetical protein HYW02_04795, partial [Deltaproteobacteria bacterium]|nr:hypothetical protein [Deltaproteobacteria bacterium]